MHAKSYLVHHLDWSELHLATRQEKEFVTLALLVPVPVICTRAVCKHGCHKGASFTVTGNDPIMALRTSLGHIDGTDG